MVERELNAARARPRNSRHWYLHCRDNENGHGGYVHDLVRHVPRDRASGNASRRYEHGNVSVNLHVNGHGYAHDRDRGCGRDHGRDDDGQKLPYRRG